MASLKLKNEVKVKELKEVTKKFALMANTCDCCGKVYRADYNAQKLNGQFDKCADLNGRGLGNQFSADCCSFICADKLMKKGWKKLDNYLPFVKAGAVLEKCTITIGRIQSKSELLKKWKKEDITTGVSVSPSGSGFVPTYTTITSVLT
jgi:hypothetical protein